MTDFLIFHLNSIIIFLVIMLLISLSNLYLIYNPARFRYVSETPFVSVLILYCSLCTFFTQPLYQRSLLSGLQQLMSYPS